LRGLHAETLWCCVPTSRSCNAAFRTLTYFLQVAAMTVQELAGPACRDIVVCPQMMEETEVGGDGGMQQVCLCTCTRQARTRTHTHTHTCTHTHTHTHVHAHLHDMYSFSWCAPKIITVEKVGGRRAAAEVRETCVEMSNTHKTHYICT